MRETIRYWLVSLRARLIVTYVMVTAISFGLLLLLLLKPVEGFLMQREKDNLITTAVTLGSTIRSPWKDPIGWRQDQFWTQRRCHDLTQRLHARVRLLDAQGDILTDSQNDAEGDAWKVLRDQLPKVNARSEVQAAISGHYADVTRPDEDVAHGVDNIYLALPILRLDPASGNERIAFIMYLNKPVEPVRLDLGILRKRLINGMVISLLFTMLVSILLSENLSAGLRAAMQVARAFAAGKMDQRMRAHGRDEVGQLGVAFNQMADALQRQEQLRRNLLADVSHELRTPLTAISGCADTLADGAMREDPEAADHFLSIIQRESQRLRRLVNDILELSKLQAGAVQMQFAPVALHSLIEDAVEIARINAAQCNQTIASVFPTTCSAEFPIVRGNEDRLAQALRNLLDNAQHHTPEGKTITVSLDIDDNRAVIHVRDEGEGIPAADLPWVFDRFYRAGKSGKSTGGTGLGLAIVREIVIAHGGLITVESNPGTGTRFSLHLPLFAALTDNQ